MGLDQGTAAWSAVGFRPRVLRGVDSVSLSTTILGTPVQTPVLVAPMGQQSGAHTDGETIGWLRELSGLPVVVKGVLRA